MSACQVVRKWVTESVRQPVERWVERAEESCEEARRWVEREVRRKIERTRTRTEKRCKRRKCKWWCACCNKWFCWFVTIVERIVEWVVEVVGEWLVETVCKIVVKLIKIVVEVVITVGRFVVVGLTCLFTDPIGALEALGDLWFDLVDIVSDIGDLIDDVLTAASDLIDITREFILDLGEWFGPIGRFIAGIIAGLLDILRRLVEASRRVIRGLFDIVTGILRLDFCAALEGLVNGIGFGLLQGIFALTNLTSVGSGGVRDAFLRQQLHDWLKAELESRFAADSVEDLEDRFQIDSSSFGARWPVQPMRCVISSRSRTLDLAAMHRQDEINLYHLAGYAPFGCREKPVYRSAWKLVYADTESRVSLGDIRAYLNDGAGAAPELELVTGDKRSFKETVRIAKTKFRQLAIELELSSLRRFEIVSQQEMIIPNDDATPLAARIKSTYGLSTLCDLPAVSVFGYDPQHFGLASASWSGSQVEPTAATIRSSFMEHLFGTVMAHEMGHCFDLRHDDHDGMHNIMFTLAPAANLTAVTGGTVVEFVLAGGEPRFTYADGQNAWRWILSVANGCIGSPRPKEKVG